MSLMGKGVLAIWHDIAAGTEADYTEWHSKQHMPERVGIPGFHRGHGGEAALGSPRYINWYEVESLETLTSEAYLARLNDPTPWSQRVLGTFRNNNRTLCRVITSIGDGVGGHLLTLQLGAEPGRGDALHDWLSATMPLLVERFGVIGAHYLEGDAAASQIETQEKRLRDGVDAIADRVVMVAGYDADALNDVRATVLSSEALIAHGASHEQDLAVYRMLHCITDSDLATHGP